MHSNSNMHSIPFYARCRNGRGIIVVAIDGDQLDRVDEIVAKHTAANYSVVVLVGDRFNAEPLKRGVAPKTAGQITAPAAWEWIRDNLPQARDCLFVP